MLKKAISIFGLLSLVACVGGPAETPGAGLPPVGTSVTVNCKMWKPSGTVMGYGSGFMEVALDADEPTERDSVSSRLIWINLDGVDSIRER